MPKTKSFNLTIPFLIFVALVILQLSGTINLGYWWVLILIPSAPIFLLFSIGLIVFGYNWKFHPERIKFSQKDNKQKDNK